MRHLGKQNHDVRTFLTQWGAGFLFAWATLVITVGIIKGESSIGRYFALKESERILSDAVASIEAENRKLSDEITKLNTSPDYARKVLRDKYHVTDDDEKIIYFAD